MDKYLGNKQSAPLLHINTKKRLCSSLDHPVTAQLARAKPRLHAYKIIIFIMFLEDNKENNEDYTLMDL